MAHQRPHRMPGDMEVGLSNVTMDHPTPSRQAAPLPRPASWLGKWERRRPIWLLECLAEAIGVAFFVYCGIGATAAFFTTSAGNGSTALGNLLTIGWAYGIGITLAVIIAGPTSGAHLNPGYTIAFAMYKGFPWRKVPQYIISQIIGGFVGALLVYASYQPQLAAITAEMRAAGANVVSPAGPAGVFAFLVEPGTNLGYVFLSELFSTAVISIVVFTVLDMSNPFISFSSAPALIGLSYAAIIWAFGPTTVVLNTARDLGGRFVGAIFWGSEAFPMRYSAISVFTNILGTQLGALVQILFLADSTRPLSREEPETHSKTMIDNIDPTSARGRKRPAQEMLQLGVPHPERAGPTIAADGAAPMASNSTL